jgi:DNA-binding LacI/PurR family transcriptional regulator
MFMPDVFATNLPMYEKIAHDLKVKIEAGAFDATRILPQERDLTTQYKVSRNTIRGALNKLVEDDLIKKIRGKGNVINQEGQAATQIVILTYDIPYQSDFTIRSLHMLEETAAELSLNTLFMNLKNDSPQSIEAIAGRLNNGPRPYGVILVGGYTRKIVKVLLEVLDVPTVLLGDLRSHERNETPLISQVVGDDYDIFRLPVKYYLEHGCTRIAAIGSPKDLIWGEAHFRGYCDAFRDFGLSPNLALYKALPDVRDQFEPLAAEVERYLDELFSLQPPPEMLLIAGSLYDIAQAAANRHHLQIPEDLTLVITSNEKQPRQMPQCINSYSDMIPELFDLLKQERQNGGKVKQRRVVRSVFYDGTE